MGSRNAVGRWNQGGFFATAAWAPAFPFSPRGQGKQVFVKRDVDGRLCGCGEAVEKWSCATTGGSPFSWLSLSQRGVARGKTPDPVVISLARAWPWIPRAMPAKADDRVTVRPDKSCAGSRSTIFYRRRYTMILDWIGLDLGLGVARFLPDTEWRGWILLLVSGLWVYISLLLLFYCFVLLFIVGLLFVVYY